MVFYVCFFLVFVFVLGVWLLSSWPDWWHKRCPLRSCFSFGGVVQFGLFPPSPAPGACAWGLPSFVFSDFSLCWGFGCALPDLIGGINDVPWVVFCFLAEWCNLVCSPPRLRQGPVLGVFSKTTLRGKSSRFCGILFSLFHFYGPRVTNFTKVRCLWPDWPYSRLSCLVPDVQATDETRTRLLSIGIRLSKGSGWAFCSECLSFARLDDYESPLTSPHR